LFPNTMTPIPPSSPRTGRWVVIALLVAGVGAGFAGLIWREVPPRHRPAPATR